MDKQNKKDVSESRREFVKNAGKLAVYTPPAMVALMKPSYASFRKSGGGRMTSVDKMSSMDWSSMDWSSKD